MKGKGINSLMREMRAEWLWERPTTPHDTYEGVKRAVTNEVLRGAAGDGWRGQHWQENARVAQKMVESMQTPTNNSAGKVDAVGVEGSTSKKAYRSGVRKFRSTKRSTSQQSSQMTQKEAYDSHEESKKGRKLACPPGYRWDSKQLQCVPKSPVDDVRANKGGARDSSPENGASYNTWGRTGVNGDGYAWAEPNNYDGNYYDGSSIGDGTPAMSEGVKRNKRRVGTCVRCGVASDRCRCLTNKSLSDIVLGNG